MTFPSRTSRLAALALSLALAAPLAAQQRTPEEEAKREQDALKRARILRIVGMPGVPASLAAALKALGAEAGEKEAKVELPAEALFDAGKAELRADAAERLKLLAHVLREFPAAPLEKPYPLVPAAIACHGEDEDLCRRRAAAVKDWLVEEAGIDPARLAPGAAAKPDAAAGKKERVEITVRKSP